MTKTCEVCKSGLTCHKYVKSIACDKEDKTKQEEYNKGCLCDTKYICLLHAHGKQKQSTSLKEEIIYYLFETTEQTVNIKANKILKLLQSHLLKEIPEEKDVKILGKTWEGKLSAANNCGYNQCREDIIKIINNISK